MCSCSFNTQKHMFISTEEKPKEKNNQVDKTNKKNYNFHIKHQMFSYSTSFFS